MSVDPRIVLVDASKCNQESVLMPVSVDQESVLMPVSVDQESVLMPVSVDQESVYNNKTRRNWL